ncbi:unnamed protein product [Ostreobium quekettii]|uniref:Protein kinase domain-containing protein n=1 Tax=Ostreobium quekettii TaxID=121088 RepID=A0A8S1J907_9CHLO|nr:unnamed protein product [Ostreobium quekettii]
MLQFFEGHAAIIAAAEDLCTSGVRYNHKTLEFLVEQMTAARRLMEEVTQTPVDEQDLCWWEDLKEALRRAKHLVQEHTSVFDIRHFYKVGSVVNEVRILCHDFAALLDAVGLEAAFNDIKASIDPNSIAIDKAYLEWYLCAIIDGGVREQQEVPKELQELQEDNKQRMQRMHLIEETEITWGCSLDKGGCSQVFACRWAGKDVAVKKLAARADNIPQDAVAEFLAEAEIGMNMRHQNVVVCYAATRSLCLVMELANSNLQRLCLQTRNLSWACKADLLLQASEGLRHVHSMGIVHRDVKSLNFLVFGTSSDNYVVKVADFGLAIVKSGATKSLTGLPMQGTELWMAPEILEGKPHTMKSDVFSLGIVMFEVASQSLPYARLNQIQVRGKKCKWRDPCVGLDECPEPLMKLMRACTNPYADRRPSMKAVCSCLIQIVHGAPSTSERREARPRSDDAEKVALIQVNTDLQERLKELTTQSKKLQKENQQANESVSHLQARVREITAQMEKLQRESQETVSHLQGKLRDTAAYSERVRSESQKTVSVLRERVKGLTEASERLKAENQELREQLRGSKQFQSAEWGGGTDGKVVAAAEAREANKEERGTTEKSEEAKEEAEAPAKKEGFWKRTRRNVPEPEHRGAQKSKRQLVVEALASMVVPHLRWYSGRVPQDGPWGGSRLSKVQRAL